MVISEWLRFWPCRSCRTCRRGRMAGKGMEAVVALAGGSRDWEVMGKWLVVGCR